MSTNKNTEFSEPKNGLENKNEYLEKLKSLVSDKEYLKESVSETTFKKVIEVLCKFSELAKNQLQNEKNEPDPGWMDTYHALKYLTISKGMLRKLRDTGKLPTYSVGGKQYFKKSDLQNVFKLLVPTELKNPRDKK